MRGGRLLITLFAVGAALAGCGDSEPVDPATTAGGTTTTTTGGGGDGTPVGDGEGGVELEQLGSFEQPVFVTAAPGDDEHLYVVEQCGRIVRIPREGGEGKTFLDVSELVTCGGEQGLLSVAFSPDYRKDGLLYVYYTDTEEDQRIVEYIRGGGGTPTADPDSAREVLRIEDFAANHNGGLLLFGPDGALYVGSGDGGLAGDPERTAQDLSSLLGKILRIDPRPKGGAAYSVPRDNPHVGDPEARPEVLVHGLRNPWRFSFDRETSDLWIGDVGQDELEEIDAATFAALDGGVDSGLNFGWSAFEGERRFNEDQEAPGARPPVLEYGRSRGCSVTGGVVVRDPELDSLYGRYLYGDFCQGELRSFTARRGDAPVKDAEDDRALGVQVPSLSSFGEDSSGGVYAASLDGAVYRLASTR